MSPLIVPLDGSQLAEHALPLALTLARRGRTGLELVTVHEPPLGVHGIHGTSVHDFALDRQRAAEERAALQRYLDGVRARVASADPAVDVRGRLLTGPPAETLAEHAEAAGADAVVLTTHGRGGVSRLWLGSVTDELVRRLTMPVVTVRPPKHSPAADSEGPWPDVPLRRVLVAVDGMPAGEAVLGPLRRLVGEAGVEYALLRVVPPLHPLVRTMATEAEYTRDLAEQVRLAGDYVDGLRDRLAADGLTASACTRPDVHATRAVLACAAELDVDLIALATHGRGPVGRLLLGSEADKVLRTASRPVLLFRVPDSTPDTPGIGREAAPAAVSVR